jgi:hypothetical protein
MELSINPQQSNDSSKMRNPTDHLTPYLSEAKMQKK